MSSSDLSMRLRRRLGSVHDESGSSIIEFIVLATVVLVPVVYLIVAVSGIQSASYASVGAADQAAKMHAAADSAAESASDDADARAEAAVEAVLDDFDIDRTQADVGIECPAGSCGQDGDLIAVTVDITVPVPILSSVGGWEPTLATVSSTSVQVRSR